MKPSFNIERITWHQVADKVDIDPIHEALNTYLDLSKYGNGVEQLSFTYVAVKPGNPNHDNEARYLPTNKTLELRLNLNYPAVKQATPSQVLEMMATLFLISINLYQGLNLPDFTISSFRKDVEHLFDSKGWLKAVPNR